MDKKVFYNELKRLVSGAEVWQLRFGKPSISHDLTFKCPDSQCDAKFILRNCAPYLDDWETGFRLYPRSVHRRDCTFLESERRSKRTVLKALPRQMAF